MPPTNYDIWSPEQFARLHTIKSQVEHEFEVTKWDRIAALIIADGGGTYTGKQLKTWWRDFVEEGEQSPPHATTPPTAGAAGAAEAQEEGEEEQSEFDAMMEKYLLGTLYDAGVEAGEWDSPEEEETPSKKKMKMTVTEPTVEEEEEEQVEAGLNLPGVGDDNDIEGGEPVDDRHHHDIEHGGHDGGNAREGEQDEKVD